MTRRFLLAVLLCGAAAAENRSRVEVDSIGITVSDLDRSLAFYTGVLQFEKVSESEAAGEALERDTGVFGARARTARLRLGEEFIELTEYLAPRGRPIPEDSRSNDRWFQHIAIITQDMAAAYKHLRAHKVRHVSPGPQRLPDWNPNAGGIEAFYFNDPDGHAAEILAFPAGKGDARWHAPSSRMFLGIDHTAIVISDIDASTKFYQDVLGMHVAGESENYGPEQERLNSVFGARLRIRAMRAASGPGVEFLQYLAPGGGRPYPVDARPNDLIHWHTKLRTGGAVAARKPGLIRDPDGHAVLIAQQ